jgi:ribose 5-phosphate isomerase RpiB
MLSNNGLATKMREIVKAFLETGFNNLERRVRRINRLDEREDYD